MKKYRERWRDLAEKIDENHQKRKVDCIAIISLPNLLYFFNYAGHSFERFCCGMLNSDGNRSALVVPKLDLEKTKNSQADNVFSWDDAEGYEGALRNASKSILAGSPPTGLGCEPSLTLEKMEQFRSTLHVKDYVQIGNEISYLRQLKKSDEISSLRDSAKRLCKSFKAFPELMRSGATESEVSFDIMKILEENGLKSFEQPLVQSGKNSAVPHATPGKKRIERGDMVVIDASGPNAEGYFSDYTRTYVIGKAGPKEKDVYETVRRAQIAGINASVFGKTAESVDIAARSVIESQGYGKFFIHRTGHGLGLEVHEAPYLRHGNKQKLAKGMVFTIEPGIYLPGKFGVRIEDNMIIWDASEDLTDISHDLIEV